MAGTFSMSASERERACVVRQLAAGLFSQAIETERLGISLRQMNPLMRLWRTDGDAGLVSQKRGQP